MPPQQAAFACFWRFAQAARYNATCPSCKYLIRLSANDTAELLDYLRVLKAEGFFNAEEPYVLSMEVTLRPGESEKIVLANTKRVLNRAWALLED